MRRKHPLLVGIDEVKPYKLHTATDLYGVRPPIMTIEDFLPAGGVMGLTSQPGVGKTWVALEATRAVASGSLFLNKFKTIRGGVLFVGADSSLYDYARQWKRLTYTQAMEDGTLFDPVRFIIQEGFLFEDRDAIRQLIATHRRFEWGETHFDPATNEPSRERGFHVIVFDTLSALTNIPESDNTGREQVFRNIRALAEITDCAIIVLHHNAQKSEFNDGTNFRGATSQLGRLDSHINLQPHRKDAYLIGVSYKKFRGIKPKEFAYRMNVGDPLVASLAVTEEPVTLQQRLEHDPLADAVVEYLKQHPKSRVLTIRGALLPRFEAGVAGPANTTLTFTGPTLRKGIQNRLDHLMSINKVLRELDDEGKAVYSATAEEPDQTGSAEHAG